jgi:hypothetical protein
MLSTNVHCMVVEVFEPGDTMDQDKFASRDLLPWADPYIARLLSGPRFQQAATISAESTLKIPPQRGSQLSRLRNDLSPPLDEFPRPDDEPLRRDPWPGIDD